MGQARQRCWRYDWIIDLDIKGFFDNIPQDLLLRAVSKHAKGAGGSVRRKLHEIDPTRSVYDISPLTEHLSDAFAENRLRTVLLTFFSLTAIFTGMCRAVRHAELPGEHPAA